MIHIDFETRSPLELTEVGVHKYIGHPEAKILLMAYSIDGGPVQLAVPREFAGSVLGHEFKPLPLDFFSGHEVWAHNAQFEHAVAAQRMFKDFGVHPPEVEQMRCTAALCRMAGLPGGLDAAAKALGLVERKDGKGKRLINAFSSGGVQPYEDPVGFTEFAEYCKQDVRVEMALHKALPYVKLDGWMLDAFHLDLRINRRGFLINRRAVDNACGVLDVCLKEAEARFTEITGLGVGQREAVRARLERTLGVELPNMQADTLDVLLETNPDCEALRLYSEIQYASVKKLYTMRRAAESDDRVRGGLQFYGASTGRWSGRLVQPQNFKKPSAEQEPHTGEFFQDVVDGKSVEELRALWGNPVEWLSACVRHFIDGPLFDADYSAIEARIVLWLAGEEKALEMFRTGRCVYKWMASHIYRKPEKDISKAERALGKGSVLGCGYGMGDDKFFVTCKKSGNPVTLALASKSVDEYRTKFAGVPNLWRAVENAALKAVRTPGAVFMANRFVSFVYDKTHDVLACELPSGRRIHYQKPKVTKGKFSYIKGLVRKTIWGGVLVENICQAIAFDLMANGALHADRAGFPITNLVHDQAFAEICFFQRKVLEVYTESGHNNPKTEPLTIERFVAELTKLPSWADGLPLKAEGQTTPYYLK